VQHAALMNWKHGLFADRVSRRSTKSKAYGPYFWASLCGLFGLRGMTQSLGGKVGRWKGSKCAFGMVCLIMVGLLGIIV
jgi:hypothetical protein